MQINLNDFIKMQQAQRKVCKDITKEVKVSPPVGSPEYAEWKKKADAEWEEYKKTQKDLETKKED